MRTIDVIRVWKDADYRSALTDGQRARLPEHPAGLIELEAEQMGQVVGGSLLICYHTGHPDTGCNTFQATCTC
jgi:mersacidin/lichenicidin family type 2 lantibiotic